MTLFDEFLVKLAALKTNPYVSHYLERTLYLERSITAVLEIFVEWVKFQRSWIYLDPVFESAAITDALPGLAKRFQGIDSFFKATIKAIHLTPAVFKMANKEGFLSQLER